MRYLGLVYKKGKFSKVEDQLLEDAIDTYARVSNFTLSRDGLLICLRITG